MQPRASIAVAEHVSAHTPCVLAQVSLSPGIGERLMAPLHDVAHVGLVAIKLAIFGLLNLANAEAATFNVNLPIADS